MSESKLNEILILAIAKAEAQYDGIVGLAKNHARVEEQKARDIVEESIKSINARDPEHKYYPTVDAIPESIRTIDQEVSVHWDSYRKAVEPVITKYKEIEKTTRLEKYAAIRRAYNQYDNAIRISAWFAFRKTYQKSGISVYLHQEDRNYEYTVGSAPLARAPRSHAAPHIEPTRRTLENHGIKCHFCGNNEARSASGLNRVRVMLRPSSDKLYLFACKECAEYVLKMWGPDTEVKPIGEKKIDCAGNELITSDEIIALRAGIITITDDMVWQDMSKGKHIPITPTKLKSGYIVSLTLEEQGDRTVEHMSIFREEGSSNDPIDTQIIAESVIGEYTIRRSDGWHSWYRPRDRKEHFYKIIETKNAN